MSAQATIPPGFRIGHWTNTDARTGCTVILCPPATVGSCDIRGSSPGSRELALLAPDKKMQEVHGLLLTGGSAFGLAAADGVVSYLEERSVGYQTPWARVPIVPAAVIFDLNVGFPGVRPDHDAGYAAALAATAENIPEGSVGAGTGATVGKWRGIESAMNGGIAMASLGRDGLIVTAVAVVNTVGDILDDQGRIIAGARAADGSWCAAQDPYRSLSNRGRILQSNTGLVALLTNARLSKVEANRAAQRGHDGLARAVKPAHTSYDGDVVFCLASGEIDADLDVVAEMGTEATAQAIRRAVTLAQSP